MPRTMCISPSHSYTQIRTWRPQVPPMATDSTLPHLILDRLLPVCPCSLVPSPPALRVPQTRQPCGLLRAPACVMLSWTALAQASKRLLSSPPRALAQMSYWGGHPFCPAENGNLRTCLKHCHSHPLLVFFAAHSSIPCATE